MFLARIDRFVNFTLMLLGAAVITTVFPVANQVFTSDITLYLDRRGLAVSGDRTGPVQP